MSAIYFIVFILIMSYILWSWKSTKEFESTINNYVDSVHLDDLAEKNKEYVGYDYCI